MRYMGCLINNVFVKADKSFPTIWIIIIRKPISRILCPCRAPFKPKIIIASQPLLLISDLARWRKGLKDSCFLILANGVESFTFFSFFFFSDFFFTLSAVFCSSIGERKMIKRDIYIYIFSFLHKNSFFQILFFIFLLNQIKIWVSLAVILICLALINYFIN